MTPPAPRTATSIWPERLPCTQHMGKTKSMLIGEIAQLTGVSARMLRYYEKHGLIAPSARSTAGYRDYDDCDVERVFHIEGLRGLGISVAEVKNAFEEKMFSFPAFIDY